MTEFAINVCFHGIGQPFRALEEGESRFWVERGQFLKVLDAVAPLPNIGLSFDDGNMSDLEIALPALLERGLRATFFVLAGRLDQPGSVPSSGLRELVKHGMRVGTHGMDHRPWRGMTDAQAKRELEEAREIIAEATGRKVTWAALPLGRYDRRVLALLRKYDYAPVFSSDRQQARRGAWLQPRFSVRKADDAAMLLAEVSARPAIVRRVMTRTKLVAKRWR